VRDGQPSADEYWESARHCEEKAGQAESPELQIAYFKLAGAWREMALQEERGY
jgi:hypothetical protein